MGNRERGKQVTGPNLNGLGPNIQWIGLFGPNHTIALSLRLSNVEREMETGSNRMRGETLQVELRSLGPKVTLEAKLGSWRPRLGLGDRMRHWRPRLGARD